MQRNREKINVILQNQYYKMYQKHFITLWPGMQ